ncbi:F-box protein At5g50450 [Cryptomeria japonica]|uniref:F-box protein At5g50450 n=1 Tax=Cryptomeria japonica TaxID=3369 RepID=UPI0025AC3F27|nr:F-box protein At5g50450 [Cryptomeria japonica]XP_057838205.1 F-box protein At5g50450 [Cryptomeria japonica]XP_057838206.1 F-box protein At5g50450 [Cryptomeria japonica]XP_057838207.1 F-box protein At5g50450 [Cryptomeria japonica]
MRTRRGNYPSSDEGICFPVRQKRRLMFPEAFSWLASSYLKENPFDALPDDLLISIMVALGSSATSPTDLVNAKLACKRFCSAASNEKVHAHASMGTLSVKASKWNDESHKYLKLCADAGNPEARYMLGMIQFYCLMNRVSGVALMAEAASASHSWALYSLGVIQFNGSGASRKEKMLRAGVLLCAKAAALGHIDAMRELGHCLQDGYGVKRNLQEGRKFVLQANAKEAILCVADRCFHARKLKSSRWPVKHHAINEFLVDWFELHPPAQGLRLCCYSKCGRPETRRHEFRRCSACGSVNYCSRACQALDWKTNHRYNCTPVDNWDERQGLEIIEQEAIEGDGNIHDMVNS